MKGVDVGVGLVSDEQGILQFFFGNFSKKRAREIEDSMKAETGLLVETSLSHAATILEDAYGLHGKEPSQAAAEYLELGENLLARGGSVAARVVFVAELIGHIVPGAASIGVS